MARQARRRWRRPDLSEGWPNATLCASGLGRMGASSNRRAAKVVFGQGVSATYGEATPKLPVSQNPSQLFGGRNRPHVRQAQEHGPGMAQGQSTPEWASLGGLSQGATHRWKASKPARPSLLLQMP
jgi:hypothetical protein